MGKRACLWAYDFVLDLAEIEHRLGQLKAQGSKGTTGTQASFWPSSTAIMRRSAAWSELVCRKMGFAESYPSPARPIRGRSTPR